MKSLSRVAAAAAASASVAGALFINGSVIAPCDSPLYCQGEVLKGIELARPFSDSKTYVDMPTRRPVDEVVAAFNKLAKPLSNNTELNDFLSTYFLPAHGDLDEVDESQLGTNATFLDSISDTVIKEFAQSVIDIWPALTRRYAGAGNCDKCATSFIPVNRTFVVAGGRFAEYYYWDSYWIIEGLLRTKGAFTGITKNMILNFLDLVEQIGFVPNGGRVYYLNRSQPPLLSQIVRNYIEHTNDSSILERAVPLLVKEHDFWINNRSVEVKTPAGKTYKLQKYGVSNNQPRPESYREDYITANNHSYYAASGIIYPETRPLNDTEKAALYANLATGAESGWDYGTRFLANPSDAARDVYFPLRSLNADNLVAVDLNSILYWNEVTIAEFLRLTGSPASQVGKWAAAAQERSRAMYELMWNATLWSYFDYNLTSGGQNIFVPRDDDAAAVDTDGAPAGQQVLFDVAQLYPFWTGAAPAQLKSNPLAVKLAYGRVDAYLGLRAGGIPATNLKTGQQWDQPNVWPPLMHVLMDGLVRTPATFGRDDPAYADVQGLALRLGQRYLDSTFCTWYATGGSTSATPRLAGAAPGAGGILFEKYRDNATNVAGAGGEYQVVEGFGWTNGVLLWTVDTFGGRLRRPDCGDVAAASTTPGRRRGPPASAVELHPWDAARTKRFGRRASRREGA